MSPLQQVAMGLVIVALTAQAGDYDLLPDPLGWALAVGGIVRLRDRLPSAGALLGLAVLAAVVALRPYLGLLGGELDVDLDPSLAWALSLPQVLFCLLLARGLAALARDPGEGIAPDEYRARWFSALTLAFGVVALAPAVVVGGGLEDAYGIVAFVAVLCLLTLVYQLFRVHAQPWVTAQTVPE